METLGILLIIFGVFTILNLYLDINLWSTFFNLWPILLIVYGIVRLLKKEKNSILSILISILGVILLLSNFNLLTPNLRTIIWASTAIIIGLVFLFSNKKKTKSSDSNYSNNDSLNNGQKLKSKKIFSNLIDLSYIFNNENIEIVSNSFSGGDIKTSFGQIVVNLKNVTPASKIMEIYCTVNVANLEILIPSTWSYEIIGKNIEEYKVSNETNRLRIYYKNILGELMIIQ